MQIKVLGAFVVGIVVCAGVMGGGLAAAKSSKLLTRKQVNVKLEWVTVQPTGVKNEKGVEAETYKTADALVLVADVGQKASSKNSSQHDGTETRQDAAVTATLNNDGTATLDLTCEVVKAGSQVSTSTCSTTLTVPLGETKVVRSFVRKSPGDSSETLLFVTTTAF